jgi:enamine deaminase RidA (YjgF/YER057c/UK114 family)
MQRQDFLTETNYMKKSDKKSPFINKITFPEMAVTSFRQNIMVQQYNITIHPALYGDSRHLFSQFAKFVRENNINILCQFVFGDSKMQFNWVPEINNSISVHNWPISFIHGDSPSDGLLYGIQAFGISGCQSKTVCLNDRIVGTRYEDNDAEYCFLGDIRPDKKDLPHTEQTRQAFENIKKALATIEMKFTNIVRTWFYIDNLLEWYSEFNVVRTTFFDEEGVFKNFVPASTGIGAGNLQGASLVACVLAIKPKHDRVNIFSVPSPMQCEATSYRSSFSRAVEIQFPNHRRLYISGTASIDKEGNSVHFGDVCLQIEKTMEVIKSITESRLMDWQNSVRAIAYFKDIRDAHLFYDYCRNRKLPQIPICIAQTDICRRDLLFEIEADFVKQDT